MSRIWRCVVMVLMGSALMANATMARAVPGCPFCGPTEPPFSQRLAKCDATLQVK